MSNFSESDVLRIAGKVASLVRAESPSDETSINILNAARAAILGSASRKSLSRPLERACPSPEESEGSTLKVSR